MQPEENNQGPLQNLSANANTPPNISNDPLTQSQAPQQTDQKASVSLNNIGQISSTPPSPTAAPIQIAEQPLTQNNNNIVTTVKKSKKKILIIGSSILGALIIAGVSAFLYFTNNLPPLENYSNSKYSIMVPHENDDTGVDGWKQWVDRKRQLFVTIYDASGKTWSNQTTLKKVLKENQTEGIESCYEKKDLTTVKSELETEPFSIYQTCNSNGFKIHTKTLAKYQEDTGFTVELNLKVYWKESNVSELQYHDQESVAKEIIESFKLK